SGDVGRDDTFGPGAWYNDWNRNTANAGHVVEALEVSGAVLDGFTIELGATGPVGTPAGNPLMYGSGLYIQGGSPRVANCVFRHNLAAFAHGGGAYCFDSGATFEGCRFAENYVHLGS